MPISCAESGTTPTTLYGAPSSRRSRPTIVGSPLKRVRQNDSLSTTASARLRSSSMVRVRPTIALTPSASNTPAVTHWRETVSAMPSAPPITMPPTPPMNPAIVSKLRLRSPKSSRLLGETRSCADEDVRSEIITTRSGSGIGSGRSSVASTSAKMALLAPMPSASVRMAPAAKPGWRRNEPSE